MNAQNSIKDRVRSAAREYAARGWHVFPVPPGAKKSHKAAKHSNERNWGATTDPDEINRDWSRWPHANVGIVTGAKSGFFVIEADTVQGHDVDGISNLAALIAKHGPLPDTIEAFSPSGSWHIYFKWPEGVEVANSAGLVTPGVDVRGEGGMVLGVPSVKPGADLPYRWKNPPGLFDLADCPDWLLGLCLKQPKSAADGPRTDTTSTANAWAEAALRDELKNVFAAPVGQRNQTLNRAAFALGQIVGGGELNEAIVTTRLTGAAQAIGLDADETAATIASGLAAGLREPRGPLASRLAISEVAPRPHTDTDTDADGFDLSHDALASDMGAQGWDLDARYVASWGGKWVFWKGTHWQCDDSLDHLTRTRAFLRTRASDLRAWTDRKADAEADDKAAEKLRAWAKGEARMLRSKTTVVAVESLARANPGSVARAEEFDQDRLLLGTPGGTVDLRNGILRPAQREDMLTRRAAVAPAPGVPVLWLAILSEIFNGDQDIIDFMQRAAGYALTGETREHKLLFLYGTGRNGKSVFLNTLFYILGEYARRAPATTFLNSTGEKHPTELAGLRGARLVVGSELPKGKSWDESVIKDLTGGDVMTARFMRGDFFDFAPQLTLMIAGNNMPSFRGVDEAIRARVVLVPFTVTIPPERRDMHLEEKLRAEAPQILQWAIDGALEWQRRGLDVPASVAAASAEYFDDEDTLGQFLTDETRADATGFVTTTALHHRFKQWCEAQGLTPWTLRTLQKEVKGRGMKEGRKNTGRGFFGVSLT